MTKSTQVSLDGAERRRAIHDYFVKHADEFDAERRAANRLAASGVKVDGVLYKPEWQDAFCDDLDTRRAA